MISDILLIFAFSLISIGVVGSILNLSNLLVTLLALEVLLLGVTLCYLFSVLINNLNDSLIFAMFILTIAACETALGLALLIAFFRLRGSVAVNNINLL